MDVSRSSDRRRARRVTLDEPVELHLEDSSAPVPASVVNLSSTGMCIGGVPGVDVGDPVECLLLFTPQEPLALAARVVWSTEAEQMGLVFEEITDHRGQRLERYLQRLYGSKNSTLGSVSIDPFCESGTWSREILVDDQIFEETAETFSTVQRHQRFLWGVVIGALAGGVAATAMVIALTR